MGQNLSKHSLALALALLIGVIVLIAAYGKFFYPLESLKTLDRVISCLEVLLVFAIFFFRKQWLMWLAVSTLFAAWCGYAIFWCRLELPCSCMGSMVEMPSALSVSMDIFFFLSSLSMGFLLGAEKKYLYLTVLIAFFTALVGYAFADWIYQSIILTSVYE